MLKLIRQSFIPYLLLFGSLVIVIIYLDNLAQQYSSEPEIIIVNSLQSEENQLRIWDYEVGINDTNDILTTDSIYNLAVTHYHQKEWSDAEKLFTTLLISYPNNRIIYNYLGLISEKRNAFDDSMKWFAAALKKDSLYVPAFINYGLVLGKVNQIRQALEMYTTATQYQPNNPKPYLNAGILLAQNDNWHESINWLTKAIDLSSGKTKAKALYFQGLAFLQLGDSSKARNNIQEAILLRPNYQLARILEAQMELVPESREEKLITVLKLYPMSATAHYHMGMFYLELGTMDKAEFFLRRSLDLNPEDEVARRELVSFLISEGRLPEVPKLFLSEKDTVPQDFFLLGKMAAENDNYVKALTNYEKAINNSKGDYPKSQLNRAIVLKKMGLLDESIASYKEAIRANSNYAEAHYNLAIVYQEKNETELALENYKTASDLNPRLYKAHFNRGKIYKNEKKFAEALDAFQASIVANPGYVKGLFELASTYYQAGENGRAIDVYSQLLNDEPSYSKAWHNLGLAYKKNQEYDQAVASFESVLRLDADNKSALRHIADIHLETGESVKALLALSEALDEDPTNISLRKKLAKENEDQGNLSEAINQYAKVLQLAPGDSKIFQRLHDLYQETNDKEKALLIQGRIIELGGNPDEAYQHARLLHKNDLYTAAIEWYDKATEFGKKSKWLWYWKGKAFHENGELNQAAVNYSMALDMDPNHNYAHLRLAEIYQQTGRSKEALVHLETLLVIDPEFSKEKNITTTIEIIKDEN